MRERPPKPLGKSLNLCICRCQVPPINTAAAVKYFATDAAPLCLLRLSIPRPEIARGPFGASVSIRFGVNGWIERNYRCDPEDWRGLRTIHDHLIQLCFCHNFRGYNDRISFRLD